jgi:hypothetical protein
VAIAIAVGVLLFLAAVRNAGQFNPDAVIYLRFAQYLLHGRFGLVASGAFAPLFSCLIAPFLALGIEPLLAARFALAACGFLFFAGSVYASRALGTPRAVPIAAAGVVGLAVVAFTVTTITADLLVDSLLLFGFGLIAGPPWPERRGRQVLAGLVFALAYFAKAVALPLTVLLVAVVTALRAWSDDGKRRALIHAFATTLLVCGLAIVPWVLILSVKYGRLTVATSSRMAHAVMGPRDVDRRSPILLGFRPPEPGRLTWGEDASILPWRDWSPFQSRVYAAHQLRLISTNRKNIFGFYKDWDQLHLGFWGSAVFAVLALVAPAIRSWRPSRGSFVPWLLAGVYLLAYAGEPRYFWLAYPFLFLSPAAIAAYAPSPSKPARRLLAVGALALVVVSFLVPVRPALASALRPKQPNPAVAAARLAASRLQAAGLAGPVAGSGDIEGEMAGLYLSFFLNQPFYGDCPDTDPEEWARSGASLIVARRDGPLAKALAGDPRFRSLNKDLFGVDEKTLPIEVYRIDAPVPPARSGS